MPRSRRPPPRRRSSSPACDAAFPGTVWVGCKNWYSDQEGTPILWPLPQDEHEDFFAEVRMDELDFVPARGQSGREAAE